ncbi:MAG: hypothetical protein WCA46_01520 [Actinocatenispora sp.]
MSLFTEAIAELIVGTTRLEEAWGQTLQASGHVDAAVDSYKAAQQGSGHAKTIESHAHSLDAQRATDAAIALLRKSADALAEYIREFAPDQAAALPSGPEPPPGAELLEHASPRSMFRRATDALARKADDLQEKTTGGTDFVMTGFSLRSPDLKPPTVSSTSAGVPSVPPSTLQGTTHPLGPADITSTAVIVVLTLIKGGEKTFDMITSRIRDRRHEH